MKSIKYIVAATIAAGLTVSSYAGLISVDWGTGTDTYLADNSLNYLTGDLIEIGTFASAPTVGSPSLAGFSVFASATDDSGGAFSEASSASETGFTHTQIYLVAFNAPTQVAATQELIFYVTDTGAGANWKFPASSDVPNSTSIDPQDGFNGATAQLVNGGVIVYGEAVADPSGPYTALETVPEPSSIALVVLGLLGGIGLIRRRS
ncbi:MAG: PEP-CTERM sorting domain-containing protein [Verrucomicrobiia bacterium]|jgi:hypothetical protein